MSKHTLKRIVNKDMKEIQRMNLSDMGIHVKFDDSSLLFVIRTYLANTNSCC